MIRLRSLLFEFDLNEPGELEKAKEIVTGLQARGFSYTGAVALAGNISHESGCEPNTTESGGTGGYGLCQWDPGYGRKQALTAFAKFIGKPKSSLATQLDFMKCELLNGYLWNGTPVTGIDKKLMYYKQSDGTYKGLSNQYVKQYNNSIINGDIAKSAAKLMDNVFKPKPGSKQQRVDNALKIDNFIKGKQTSNTATASSEKITSSDCTIFPNPIGPNDEVTIRINQDKLPIESLDIEIFSGTGKSYSTHHWDDIQRGILKFTAPEESGVYIIQLSNNSNKFVLRLLVR